MNRLKIERALVLGLFIWASVASFLYLRLKNNPRVIAVTTEIGRDILPNSKVSDLERVTYLRQFLERYFNYDSENFWPSQTSLSFLMSPDLRAERVSEVSRLREKIQQKNLLQKARINSIRLTSDLHYVAQITLLTKTHTDIESAPEQLFVSVILSLEASDRTLENPWGILVKTMSFSPSPTEFASDLSFNLSQTTPLTITFPCSLQNVETSGNQKIETKITTLNVSELQILATDAKLEPPEELIALCRDQEFHLSLTGNEKLERNVYFNLESRMGEARRRDHLGKPKGKDIYEQTIEKVLGVKIRE